MNFSDKIVQRLLIYILGLFFLAIGVAFSVNSNLGVSPVNSLPLIISNISGIKMGTCVTAVFSAFVLTQILILRRDFKWINLLQVLFATIFGYFVNFAKALLGSFAIPTYIGQIIMLSISIFFIALGLTFYLSAKIVPMPMEGLTAAMVMKLPGISFHKMKIVLDTAAVAGAAVLSLVFRGNIDGLGEGTLITALACGKLMAVLMKRIQPYLDKLCSGDNI